MSHTNPHREALKQRLMFLDPTCTGCAKRLRPTGPDNPHLAADHLFCSRCVNKVRQRKLPVQLAIIAEMKAARTMETVAVVSGLVTQ